MSHQNKSLRLCRICLVPETQEQKFIKFFDKNFNFPYQLFFSMSISILEFNKVVPVLICQKCQSDLTIAFEFKKALLVAERFFNELTHDEEMKILQPEENSSDFHSHNVKAEVIFEELENADHNHFDNSYESDQVQTSDKEFSNDDFDILEFQEKIVKNKRECKKKDNSKSRAKTTRGYVKGGKTEGICEICGKNLWSAERLSNHIKVRHEIVPIDEYIDCPIEGCTKSFKIQLYVDRHVENMHNPNTKKRKEEKFPCSFCGIFLGSRNALKQHENRHMIPTNGDKILSHSCDLCGYKADKKIKVLYHIERVHLHLRKFKCKLCPSDFVHASLLNYHELTVHLNLRKFSCRFNCGKSFTRSTCRNIHERIHKNERPYSCKYCDRTFIHHSDHRRHELRHTGGISAKNKLAIKK